MGSVTSPPRLTRPPPQSPEFSPSQYRVYASFCPKDPSSDMSMSNWIECFNPCNNTWTRVTSIPFPGLGGNHFLKDFVMVSLGTSIYIIGGRLCRKQRTGGSGDVPDVDKEIEVLSSVWSYNVLANDWSMCAPLGMPRYDFACSVCEDKIYVAGGKSELACARGISYAEVYDPKLNIWAHLPNMSTLRYKCVGVTWKGKIHVVGGFVGRIDSNWVPFPMDRSSAEVYNTKSGRWGLAAGMWQLDVPPNQIVAVDNKLFSSGDCFKAWKGHIEAYDDKLSIWNVVDGSHLQTLNSPISTNDDNWPPIERLYLTMAPVGSHLFFLAGYRTAGELSRTMSRVHIFDTSSTNSGWRHFEPMEEDGEKELCSHCCVVQIPSRNV